MDSLSVQGEAGVGRLFKAAGVMDKATTVVFRCLETAGPLSQEIGVDVKIEGGLSEW